MTRVFLRVFNITFFNCSNEGDKEDPVAIIDDSTKAKKRGRKAKRHGALTNNKELDGNDVKITDDAVATSKLSKNVSKAEKRRQPEDQCEQSPKKKYKMNNLESISETEVEITDKEANESWRRKGVDNQNHNGSNTKQARKKVAFREKIKKGKKLEKTKRKDSKQKDTDVGIDSLNPERLKTYGINPKKLKNKLKYGKK